MRKIILASHGGLAAGLADTANMIIGDMAGDITVYSLVPGAEALSFTEELKKEILTSAETEYIIMADLYGASVCNALSSLTQYPNVRLFSGMNLSMLLSICAEHTGTLESKEINAVIKDARDGIRYIDIKTIETENDEF